SAGASRPVYTVPADAASPEQAAAAVEQACRFLGGIDVLINSAGCSMHAPCSFESVSTEEYKRIMDTNVDGVFYTTRSVLKIMKEQQSGYIINILSTASHAAAARGGPYSASKHAALALTETLAAECRGSGIRITSISPGPVATTIWSHKTTPPSEEEMARMLKPGDIARIAGFLLDNPEYVHIRDIEVTPAGF
ncbi:SDR family oxidoreductase, partial [Enterocloster asparagiformis]